MNLCDKTESSPLYKACERTVFRLLNFGAGVNICTKIGSSPLHIASENRHLSIVQFFSFFSMSLT